MVCLCCWIFVVNIELLNNSQISVPNAIFNFYVSSFSKKIVNYWWQTSLFFLQNSFILAFAKVWIKVADWTAWQSVCQTSNCFDLTASSIEIDRDLVGHFHSAASIGDVRLVESLLQEGVPVDCVDEGDGTALFYAVQYNRTDVIRLLLQKGADVNKRDCWGDTPVHYAAMWNSTKAIAMLVECGASINITNNRGEKPIGSSRRYGIEAVVRMLEQL